MRPGGMLRIYLAIGFLAVGCGSANKSPPPSLSLVAGAVVLSDGAGPAGTAVILDGAASTLADSAGRFSLSVAPGAYTLELAQTGYAVLQQPVTIAGASVNLGSFTLSRVQVAPDTGSIAGQVSLGAAVTGNATIAVSILGTSFSALTRDDGSFEIVGVPPGTYSLQLALAGYVPQSVNGVAVVAGQTTQLAAIALQAAPPPSSSTGSVAGRALLDGAQSGNGGIHVYVPGTSFVAFTDDSGAFVIDGAPPGTYAIDAEMSGYVTAEQSGVEVIAGQTIELGSLELQPEPAATGSVTGVATLAGASDFAGISVYLLGTAQVARTASDGSYRFDQVSAGTWSLLFSEPGYTDAEISGVVVGVGTNAGVPAVSLAASPIVPSGYGQIFGRVTRAGAALGNLGIAVYLEDTQLMTVTDDTGAFELSQVLPGTYRLDASAIGYAAGVDPGLLVTANGETQAPEIDLVAATNGNGPATGSLSGIAGPLGQTNLSGVTVAVTSAAGAAAGSRSTSSSGAWSILNLPVGFYELTFSLAPYQPTSLAQVAVFPGANVVPQVTLYLGALVSPLPLTGFVDVPGGNFSLVQFGSIRGETLVYDWGARTSLPLVPGSATLLNQTSDGAFADIRSDWQLLRANLSSGALTGVSGIQVPNGVLGVFGGRLLFADGVSQSLKSLGPDETAAVEAAPFDCQVDWSSGEALTLNGQPIGAWAAVTGTRTCGASSSGYVTMLADAASAHGSPMGQLLSVTDDGSRALMLTYSDDLSDPSLIAIDLQSGDARTLRTSTWIISSDADQIALFDDVDPSSRLGTISQLDLHTGAIIDLVTLATSPLVVGTSQWDLISAAGSPAENVVIHADTGLVSSLCPVSGSRVEALTQWPVIFCSTGTGGRTLISFDLDSGATRTLTEGYDGDEQLNRPSRHVVSWTQGSAGVYFARTDLATGPFAECPGSSSVEQPTISADERYAATTCGAKLTLTDLTTGTQQTLFTLPANALFNGVSLGNANRAVVAGYYTVSNEVGSYYGLVLDTLTGGSLIIPYASPVIPAQADIGSSAPGDVGFVFGYQQVFHVLLTDGAPTAFPLGDVNGAYDISDDGRFAFIDTYSGVEISDAQLQQLSAPLGGGLPARLGSSSQYLSGDYVFDLSAGSSVRIGDSIQVIATTSAGTVTYLDGQSHALSQYAPQAGVTTIAAYGSVLLTPAFTGSSATVLFAGASAQAGALLDLHPDGTLVTLATSAAPQITQLVSTPPLFFVWADPSTVGGDALLVNLASDTSVALPARAQLEGIVSVAGTRVVFPGWLGTGKAVEAATAQEVVAAIDGSSARSLGAASTGQAGSFSGRAVFDASGLFWLETALGPALAIDHGSHPTLYPSPDRRSFLYVESGAHAGTYRVDLP